jgi:hypothetical protein
MTAQPCHRAARALGVLLLLVVQIPALAGCGSSSHGIASKSPRQILAAALAASDAATSVHVTGSIEGARAPEAFDIEIVAARGARGTVSAGGTSFELIENAGTVYMKGDAAFYRRIGGAEAARLLNGKWLKAPASGPKLSPLLRLTDLHGLIASSLAGHAGLAHAGTTVIGGVAVVGVADAAKHETVYVATKGVSYPVEISKTGAGGGTITFDRWNAPVVLAPPSHAIDITALQARG